MNCPAYYVGTIFNNNITICVHNKMFFSDKQMFIQCNKIYKTLTIANCRIEITYSSY